MTALPALVKRFGDLNVHNGRLVTSYAFRDGAADPDGATGKLTSAAFTVPGTVRLAPTSGLIHWPDIAASCAAMNSGV